MTSPVDMAGRTGAILSRFPSFMSTPTPDKVVATIASALGQSLDEAERLMTRIQRAHRVQVADEAADLLHLAALADVVPADFFVLDQLHRRGYFAGQIVKGVAVPPSDLEREQRGYGLYVSELRDSVRRMVALVLAECGTIWALLEGTAIVLDADRVGDSREVTHLDAGLERGGFVHRIAIRYHVVTAGEPAETDGFLYMVENPVIDRSTADSDRRQRETFRVRRDGFFDGPVAVEVTGVAGRTVRPLVLNRTTHEGVGFDGALADGQRLVFTTEGTALLDGVDVTVRAWHFRGALADASPVDGSPPGDVAVVVTPERAMDRNFPRTPVVPVTSLPVLGLPIGDNDWRFSVEEGAFDASAFDLAVFALPADPVALAGLPPSGRVKLDWRENEPFAVSILIPSDLQSLVDGGVVEGDLPTLVRSGLERFRAAGIRLDVRYFDEAWVLGHSVLHGLDAPPGPGVDFDATVAASLSTS